MHAPSPHRSAASWVPAGATHHNMLRMPGRLALALLICLYCLAITSTTSWNTTLPPPLPLAILGRFGPVANGLAGPSGTPSLPLHTSTRTATLTSTSWHEQPHGNLILPALSISYTPSSHPQAAKEIITGSWPAQDSSLCLSTVHSVRIELAYFPFALLFPPDLSRKHLHRPTHPNGNGPTFLRTGKTTTIMRQLPGLGLPSHTALLDMVLAKFAQDIPLTDWRNLCGRARSLPFSHGKVFLDNASSLLRQLQGPGSPHQRFHTNALEEGHVCHAPDHISIDWRNSWTCPPSDFDGITLFNTVSPYANSLPRPTPQFDHTPGYDEQDAQALPPALPGDGRNFCAWMSSRLDSKGNILCCTTLSYVNLSSKLGWDVDGRRKAADILYPTHLADTGTTSLELLIQFSPLRELFSAQVLEGKISHLDKFTCAMEYSRLVHNRAPMAHAEHATSRLPPSRRADEGGFLYGPNSLDTYGTSPLNGISWAAGPPRSTSHQASTLHHGRTHTQYAFSLFCGLVPSHSLELFATPLSLGDPPGYAKHGADQAHLENGPIESLDSLETPLSLGDPTGYARHGANQGHLETGTLESLEFLATLPSLGDPTGYARHGANQEHLETGTFESLEFLATLPSLGDPTGYARHGADQEHLETGTFESLESLATPLSLDDPAGYARNRADQEHLEAGKQETAATALNPRGTIHIKSAEDFTILSSLAHPAEYVRHGADQKCLTIDICMGAMEHHMGGVGTHPHGQHPAQANLSFNTATEATLPRATQAHPNAEGFGPPQSPQ